MKTITLLPSILFSLFISGCSGLFYYPDHHEYSTPDKFQIDYESHYFTARDGTKLHGWHLKNSRNTNKEPPLSTIVYFHGNAENLSSHFLFPAWLTKHGHDVFIFDYRGYGKSEGSPSAKGTHQDALAAMEFAYENLWKNGKNGKKRKGQKFIIYGQSLGGIIATRALADFPHKKEVDHLILESSFSSYQKMAGGKMRQIWFLLPFSPLSYLLVSDEMSSEKILKDISPIPILVIHGMEDQVVPLKFGEKTFELAGEPKDFWKVPGAGHGDIFHSHPKKEQWRKKLLDHFKKYSHKD